jgi:hypothetical protein
MRAAPASSNGPAAAEPAKLTAKMRATTIAIALKVWFIPYPNRFKISGGIGQRKARVTHHVLRWSD